MNLFSLFQERLHSRDDFMRTGKQDAPVLLSILSQTACFRRFLCNPPMSTCNGPRSDAIPPWVSERKQDGANLYSLKQSETLKPFSLSIFFHSVFTSLPVLFLAGADIHAEQLLHAYRELGQFS